MSYHIVPLSISTMIQSCHRNVETWRFLEGCLDLMLGIFHGAQTVLHMMSVTATGFSLIRLVCWRGQRYEDLKNMVCVMHVIHLHLQIILFFWYAVPQAQSTEKGLAYRPKTKYSDLDQLLNADDVAAKSCIKSDMINTSYEAINGWICNFTGKLNGKYFSISEVQQQFR